MTTNGKQNPLPAIPVKPLPARAVPAVPARAQKTQRPPEAPQHPKAVNKLHVPWVRIFLLVVYMGLVIVGINYEMQARKLMGRGRNLEQAQKYRGAVLAYSLVVEKFPYSLAAANAREGLIRTEETNFQGPRICRTPLEMLLGSKGNPYEINQFCLAVFPLSAALLLLVAIGRAVLRIPSGWCWLLIFLAIGCTVFLCWSYGFFGTSSTSQTINQSLLGHPFVPQLAALLFLAMPMLLSLRGRGHRVTSEGDERAE